MSLIKQCLILIFMKMSIILQYTRRISSKISFIKMAIIPIIYNKQVTKRIINLHTVYIIF